MRKFVSILVAASAVATTAQAQWTSSRPDGHAPIGVMGDHKHEANELMLSYRFMYMSMEGSRDGTSKIADRDVVSPTGPYGYNVTPTSMPMKMHMFGLMYGATSGVTIMASLPYLSSSMDHLTRAGGTFTTSSGAVGDLGLSGLFDIATWDRQFLMGQLGVSIPTGSINQQDVTPLSAPNTTQLPYPMQTGSGTWDIDAALTYQGQVHGWSWGAQGGGRFRTGTNDNGYRLGNKYWLTGWGAVKFASWLSASLRAQGRRVDNITGVDSKLTDPVMTPGGPTPAAAFVPTADPNLRAGTSGDIGIGINTSISKGPLHGLRLAVEGLVPVYQKLDGPQLETDWYIIAGVQYTIEKLF
jgi:hypothetical protein